MITNEKAKRVRYPDRVGDHLEYPLWTHFGLCPTARYVGGVSFYLCECPDPENCQGVQAVKDEIEKAGWTIVKPK